VPVDKGTEMDVYLAEGRSIGGLSGSPVFIRESLHTMTQDSDRNQKAFFGHGQLYLLGLMRGHWETELLPAKMQKEQVEAVNMGISVVVPAQKIWEVLHHPELVNMRKGIDEHLAERDYPTLDKVKDTGKDEQSFTRDDFESVLNKATRKITPKR
jgi:hypothetical protein